MRFFGKVLLDFPTPSLRSVEKHNRFALAEFDIYTFTSLTIVVFHENFGSVSTNTNFKKS